MAELDDLRLTVSILQRAVTAQLETNIALRQSILAIAKVVGAQQERIRKLEERT